MTTWYSIRAFAKGAEVSIHDEIGAHGVSAREFLVELKALEDVDHLTVRINSPGGSVFDGLAIYNALRRHRARVTVFVEGIAASIASVIVCAGDEVVMPENAMLMLHEPSAVVAGTAEDLLSMAAALEKMRGSLVAAYRAKTGLAQERIEELMSRETWLSASEALELGFTDRIEQAVEMAACFDLSGFRNAPEALSLPSSINNEESITMNEHTKPPSEQADDAGEKNSVKPAEAASTEPSKSAAQTDEARERSAQIVDLDAVRAAERKATLAYVAEVNELCALAGRGELAADFIARALPAEQVRKALLEARAAEDEASAIRSHKSGEPTASAEPVIDTAAIYAARNNINHKEGA